MNPETSEIIFLVLMMISLLLMGVSLGGFIMLTIVARRNDQ